MCIQQLGYGTTLWNHAKSYNYQQRSIQTPVVEEMSKSTGQLTNRRAGLDEFTVYLPHMLGQAEDTLQHPNSNLESHSERQK